MAAPDPFRGTEEQFARLIAEWLARNRQPINIGTNETATAGPSVNEILLGFMTHAEKHYRHPDGTPTSEIKELRASLRPLKELYGTTPGSGVRADEARGRPSEDDRRRSVPVAGEPPD